MANVRIRDIAVVEQHDVDGDAPVGEGPKRGGDASPRKLDALARSQMIQRLFISIDLLMKYAHSEHDTYCRKDSSDERDADYITRISTAEFSYYTIEPLTLDEFEILQNRIVAQARHLDKGIHLVLGSFSVVTEDGHVMNVTPHIVCGEPPSVTLLVKNLTSAIDVRYKEVDASGSVRTLPTLDNTCFPPHPLLITINEKKIAFQLHNIIQCTTLGGTPFLTGIDICEDHVEALVKKNAKALVELHPLLGQQPFSHMVVSNSVRLVSEHCIGTPMHVDPIMSIESCKKDAQQEHKTTLIQPFAKAYMNVYTTEATSCLSILQNKDALKRKMESVISPLREQFEQECNTLSSMGFGESDEQMREVLMMTRTEIENADYPREVQDIIRTVKTMILLLSENEQLREVKKMIQELRSDTGKLVLGAEEKAARIEALAARIPFEDRCNSSPDALNENLAAAMAFPPLLTIGRRETQTTSDFKAKLNEQFDRHDSSDQDDDSPLDQSRTFPP